MTTLWRTILFAAAALITAPAFAQAASNAIPECEPGQLKTSNPPGPDGGAGNSASVFQVINASRQTCILTGVPKLRLLDGRGKVLNLSICTNCADYIFPAKPIKTITLHPEDAAHFLIGLRFADASELRCGRLSRVEVLLDDGASSLKFGFAGLRVCGKIDVSGWRTDVYTDAELQRDPAGGE